jgi:hypothetical protein
MARAGRHLRSLPRTGRQSRSRHEFGQQEEGALLIMNPSRLDPVESVDFCGACHRTWEDVVTNGTCRIEPPLCALPPRKQQVLEQARCSTHLRCLPRSPSASGARSCSLRFTLSAMSRQSAGRKNHRRSPRLGSPSGLPRQHEELHNLPHAESTRVSNDPSSTRPSPTTGSAKSNPANHGKRINPP